MEEAEEDEDDEEKGTESNEEEETEQQVSHYILSYDKTKYNAATVAHLSSFSLRVLCYFHCEVLLELPNDTI